MELIMRFWTNVDSLRSLSSYLQWISISLVFIGGGLQIAKYAVDRREKDLVALIQSQKEKEAANRESHLLGKVETLEVDLSKRQSEIEELNKKTEFVDPFRQPLRTGTATVDVIISSSENVNAHFMDQGGYIAFEKGNEALLTMASIDCFGEQIGNNRVKYRGVFNLDATDISIGKPISHLVESDFAQIGFLPIPTKSQIVSGTAICTFNSTVRIVLTIPPQKMVKDFMIAPEIKNAFKEYLHPKQK